MHRNLPTKSKARWTSEMETRSKACGLQFGRPLVTICGCQERELRPRDKQEGVGEERWGDFPLDWEIHEGRSQVCLMSRWQATDM